MKPERKMSFIYKGLRYCHICVIFGLILSLTCFQGSVALKVKNCTCGEDYNVRGRIVGGEEAIESEFPWQVAIYNDVDLQCGASLINDRYILSAAHCFKTILQPYDILKVFDINEFTYIFGGHNLGDLEAVKNSGFPVLFRKPTVAMIHPLYNPKTFYCDLSLSKLDRPIDTYTFNILPVCLPPPKYSFINMASTVSGWGALGENLDRATILMKTDVRILPHHICEEKLGHHFIKAVMMCAAKPGHDACQGDSGGPLVSNFKTDYYYQIGIVSYGIGCGDYNYPGVYTRLNRFLKWILANTEDAYYCKRQQL